MAARTFMKAVRSIYDIHLKAILTMQATQAPRAFLTMQATQAPRAFLTTQATPKAILTMRVMKGKDRLKFVPVAEVD